MKQDFSIFLNVLKEALAYLFGWDLSGWWAGIVENGTDKLWLGGICLVLVLVFVGGFFHWSLRFLAYCIGGSFVGIVFVAGESPALATITLLVLYVTATLAAGSGKNYRLAAGSALLILAVSGLFLVVSNRVGVPALKNAFGDVLPLREKIQNTSLVHVLNELLPEELKFQDGIGEYEGGSLEAQEGGPEFSGETVISVESDRMPESPVYWARYVGNVYTGYSFDDSGDLDDPENPASLAYPKNRLGDLEAFCQENPVYSPLEAKEFIIRELGNRTSYNLLIGPQPEEKDFIEYFFFESREGYCIHYAATAVIMLRMYGIPSRYVTGFLIPPSMFYETEDGIYEANVPDDHAHAWAEAYIDGQWVRVEATPSGGVPIQEQEETEQRQEEGNRPTEEGSQGTEPQGGMTEPVQTERPDSQGQGGDKSAEAVYEELTDDLLPSWVFLPVILLLALILVIGGLFGRRVWVLERRKKESVNEIFADTYEVLLQGGLSPEYDSMSEEFVPEVLEKFPWIQEEELREVLEIMMRTSYGPLPAGDEEWLKVQRFYYLICRQIGKNLKGMSKFAFYLVDVWI